MSKRFSKTYYQMRETVDAFFYWAGSVALVALVFHFVLQAHGL